MSDLPFRTVTIEGMLLVDYVQPIVPPDGQRFTDSGMIDLECDGNGLIEFGHDQRTTVLTFAESIWMGAFARRHHEAYVAFAIVQDIDMYREVFDAFEMPPFK